MMDLADIAAVTDDVGLIHFIAQCVNYCVGSAESECADHRICLDHKLLSVAAFSICGIRPPR